VGQNCNLPQNPKSSANKDNNDVSRVHASSAHNDDDDDEDNSPHAPSSLLLCLSRTSNQEINDQHDWTFQTTFSFHRLPQH
jgi:hypothetical protein